MRLSFDSIDEVKEFVKALKGTRGGKSGDADDAPAGGSAPTPIQPPAGGQAGPFNPVFAPPAPAAATATAFPAPTVSAEVVALVQRITAKIDSAIASGQPAENVLTWFRSQCGPEAAAATMDQVKQVFLPRAPQPTLENIAKLMNA